MRKYESMILVSANLPEDKAKEINQQIVDFIKKNGGEINNSEEWGKRKLSYEIEKQEDAYFFVNYFELDPQEIDKLETQYRFNENIIRYNILVKR
ncbi:MAG: 30S ribosomal protein S6 [Candidatus Cloacimonadota bacterium]|nr:30S ribosomal protein S6 [Candidatus Cloacimonadota bacterium]